MKKSRKPIVETNIINVILLCIFFAVLMGGITENLTIFIASVLTIPLISLLLFLLWLKYGHSGIHLNSINVCIMLTMMSFYSSIPLISVIWEYWVVWLPIIIHIVTFVVGYINRERLSLGLNGKKEKGKPSRLLLIYCLIILILGFVGYITLQVTVATTSGNVFIFGFLYLFSYCFFAISPGFLIRPERALELEIITQRHYDEYN